jgi:hypothetical protein
MRGAAGGGAGIFCLLANAREAASVKRCGSISWALGIRKVAPAFRQLTEPRQKALGLAASSACIICRELIEGSGRTRAAMADAVSPTGTGP